MQSAYEKIFKANDIRGIVGETLDEDIARRIGRALGAQMRRSGVQRLALGRDGRLSSPALAAALAEGLSDVGMTVADVGLVPTPALYFAAVTHCGGNGVMVTGSHNPKHYNGMKMMHNGKVIMGEAMTALRQAALGEVATSGGGAVAALDVQEAYIAAVAAAHPLSRPLKIVLDAGNGAAGGMAPALFRAMGCEVQELFCEVDGDFPNHHPDPAQMENLRDAADALAAGEAEVAFAFDGDGDRLGVLPRGKAAMFADRLLMLYARDLLHRHAGARVVFDVKCSALLAPWVAQHGGIADMQPTGHAFIKARMAETGALLGGEMSGHFYFRDNWYGFDDALFAAARTAALLADNPAVCDDIPEAIASPELHVDMAGRDQHQFIAELAAQATFPDAQRVVTIDGLRVEYADGFGLVRASNTTPALVLRFEAQDAGGLERIKETFRRLLTAADATLKIPF